MILCVSVLLCSLCYVLTTRILLQWLTTHEPSTEHDLSSGLRENFDARARWRSAIGAVRGLHRMANLSKAAKSTSGSESSPLSAGSGGWRNGTGMGTSDDDDDDDEEAENKGEPAPKAIGKALGKSKDPGSNENVKVTAPEDEELSSDTHALKREPLTPLHKKSTSSLQAVDDQIPAQPQSQKPQSDADSVDTFLTAEEEEELRIPGSFDMSNPRPKKGEDMEDDDADDDEGEASWAGLFKKMGLR